MFARESKDVHGVIRAQHTIICVFCLPSAQRFRATAPVRPALPRSASREICASAAAQILLSSETVTGREHGAEAGSKCWMSTSCSVCTLPVAWVSIPQICATVDKIVAPR